MEALAHTYHCHSGKWEEGKEKVIASATRGRTASI